ncbi:MAG: GNAT family N-acetyltransferase, partial [Desulfobacterales bacterium]|nr:GNAT family N-acetyltransferase [Desulfobacterales bacterium]
LVGFAVFHSGRVRFPGLVDKRMEASKVGCIEDVVVSRERAGEDLGSKMLERVTLELMKRGVETVYTMSHGPISRRLHKMGAEVIYPGLTSYPRRALISSMLNKGFRYGGMLALDRDDSRLL